MNRIALLTVAICSAALAGVSRSTQCRAEGVALPCNAAGTSTREVGNHVHWSVLMMGQATPSDPVTLGSWMYFTPATDARFVTREHPLPCLIVTREKGEAAVFQLSLDKGVSDFAAPRKPPQRGNFHSFRVALRDYLELKPGNYTVQLRWPAAAYEMIGMGDYRPLELRSGPLALRVVDEDLATAAAKITQSNVMIERDKRTPHVGTLTNSTKEKIYVPLVRVLRGKEGKPRLDVPQRVHISWRRYYPHCNWQQVDADWGEDVMGLVAIGGPYPLCELEAGGKMQVRLPDHMLPEDGMYAYTFPFYTGKMEEKEGVFHLGPDAPRPHKVGRSRAFVRRRGKIVEAPEVPPRTPADELRDFVELRWRAAGVELLEVTEVKTETAGSHSNAICQLRSIRNVGESLGDELTIYQLADLTSPTRLRHDSLQRGQRYWFLVAPTSGFELVSVNTRIYQWCLADDSDLTKAFERAADGDWFKWSPQFVPSLGLAFGHRTDIAEDQWKIRVTRKDEVLWERALAGQKAGSYDALYAITRCPTDLLGETAANVFVRATSARQLGDENAFGMPAGKYYIASYFDINTGKLAANTVLKYQPGQVELLTRTYDLKSGKRRAERDHQHMDTGGIAAGGDRERWFRRSVRTYDGDTGELVKEEVFRFAQVPESKWVKVEQEP